MRAHTLHSHESTLTVIITDNSVQFSGSVMSDSLRPHELQHARPPCSSPTPRVYPHLCPLHQWCHPTIASSVVPFFSHCHLSQYQGLFKWVNSSHQVAKVLEFQLQHQYFQWTPGLISFRMDWLDLLAVQRTLKSKIQSIKEFTIYDRHKQLQENVNML